MNEWMNGWMTFLLCYPYHWMRRVFLDIKNITQWVESVQRALDERVAEESGLALRAGWNNMPARAMGGVPVGGVSGW